MDRITLRFDCGPLLTALECVQNALETVGDLPFGFCEVSSELT
jgi:hypothetical protein